MYRDKSIEEIYDGKFYGLNDLAKIDCGGCKGCSASCHGMGSSIVLDPLDAHRLATGLKTSVAALLQDHLEVLPGTCDPVQCPARLELNVVDGIILPNLKLSGEDEACTFLNAEGRCSVHRVRPGVCRLFPLGRYYDGSGDFTYIVQAGECPYPVKSKVKVKKWIDTPNYTQYHQFVLKWHDFLKKIRIYTDTGDDAQARTVSMMVLKTFYLKSYPENGFYEEFERRITPYV